MTPRNHLRNEGRKSQHHNAGGASFRPTSNQRCDSRFFLSWAGSPKGSSTGGIVEVVGLLTPAPAADYQDFFRCTRLPFFLALASPMAIACFRLLTLQPLPLLPVLAVPRL
jgi:hypothetical protein